MDVKYGRRLALGFVAAAAAGGAIAAEAAPPPTEISFSDTFEPIDAPEFFPVFGTTDIAAAPDPMGANALVFNTTGNEDLVYDQVAYSTFANGYGARKVALGFQLLTVDLLGSNNAFTLLFDTPQVRNLIFTSSGNIDVLNPGTGVTGQTIGTFADGELLTVLTEIDLAANRWMVRINGAALYSDEVLSPGALAISSVRFSHGSIAATGGDPLSFSFLDDVALTATDFVALPTPPDPVPLPAAVWGMLAGLGTLATRLKR